MVVFWSLAFLMPRMHTLKLATLAIGIAFSVEISQLYHAPWIDHLRDIKLLALVLGSGFLWIDLLCYTLGIAIAAVIHNALNSTTQTKA